MRSCICLCGFLSHLGFIMQMVPDDKNLITREMKLQLLDAELIDTWMFECAGTVAAAGFIKTSSCRPTAEAHQTCIPIAIAQRTQSRHVDNEHVCRQCRLDHCLRCPAHESFFLGKYCMKSEPVAFSRHSSCRLCALLMQSGGCAVVLLATGADSLVPSMSLVYADRHVPRCGHVRSSRAALDVDSRSTRAARSLARLVLHGLAEPW
jgi:hypothetical protein